MHVTMSLFEVHETRNQSMNIQLESLFSKFGLMHRVIAFMKNESKNLTTMVLTLHSIINCEPLKLIKFYEGMCFGHVCY
jgi:hypothetical protein